MLTLYTLVLRILKLVSQLSQPFSTKHRKWWNGRRHQVITTVESKRPVWIHCASLGEFEQGRPIIERIRKLAPDLPIVLTFFSPSGYEVRKNYEGADAIYYLPIDLPKPVNKFIRTVQPRLAIFVKYEFWFNYLWALKQQEIPFLYVSVLLRPNHFILRPVINPLTNVLRQANQIFTQNESTRKLLVSREFGNTTLGGDTRVDRVAKIAQFPRKFDKLADHSSGKRVIVYGSVWPSDMKMFRSFLKNNLDDQHLHIIAPHKIDGGFVKDLMSELDSTLVRLTNFMAYDGKPNVVLVDTIGDLADLYQFASLAYVGGGFGSGIHSILEPAAHCKPIIFGPKYGHFAEAQIFIDSGAAKCIKNALDFENAAKFYGSIENYDTAKIALEAYLKDNQGATSIIVDYIEQQNWLI